MALSEKQAKQVAEEKRRASLRGGDSPAKADRYAREVIDYARAERARKAGGR